MTFLTIITVVRDDWPGLRQTLASVRPHQGAELEHWVIDGSTTDAVRTGLGHAEWPWVRLLSEPDEGLYDAMNKGLDRASGDYVLFLNAGDELHESFDLDSVRHCADGSMLVGYTVECWADDEFLHPGVGHEARALSMPAHPATFIPREFYVDHRYSLSRPIRADAHYMRDAARRVAATFVPVVVSRFALGGRSSTYGHYGTLLARYREDPCPGNGLRLAIKAIAWRVLPRKTFYRALARGKFTRVDGAGGLNLATTRIPLGRVT